MKLILLTTIVLVVASGVISSKSSSMFEQISSDREEDSNRDQAMARATEVGGLLNSYIDKVKVIAALMLRPYGDEEDKRKSLDLTFKKDRDLVSMEVRRVGHATETQRIINTGFLEQYNLSRDYIDKLRAAQTNTGRFQVDAVYAGEVEIRNASLEGGAPLMTIGVPIARDDLGQITYIAIADIRLDRLQKVFANITERTMFLIDGNGTYLAHPEEKKVFSASSSKNVLVTQSLESDLKQGQTRYTDVNGEKFTGAYAKTSLGPTVIALASEDVILEAAHAVQKEAYYIAGIVLSLTILVIFAFSISLTHPIEKLVEVTREIAVGNFDVRSNVSSHDELGELAEALDDMVTGLAERDKMRNVLNKFHGSTVADDLINRDLELGGQDKQVTVFFSDIRGFTKYGEAHSANEVVEMLNEYFHEMVTIINGNNGVVDKFIGDAIMAVWGVPQKTELDAQNAVKACLDMRKSLEVLNAKRIERGDTPIQIGMGLHSGHVISGNIGSDERMEFTVIGDAVNQAARIEASTKAFGSDLLISDSTAALIQDSFIIEEAGKVEVKGKEKPLTLFKVKGYIDESGQEVLVQTTYSDYEAAAAEKVKIV